MEQPFHPLLPPSNRSNFPLGKLSLLITRFISNFYKASRRVVASRLGEPSDTIIKKFFTTIAPKFVTRNGGYTRVIKLGRMPSGRDEAVIEFVE